MSVHICGVGDFAIDAMEEMEDPMPLPRKQMRHLVKTGKVYAPMANLGPVVFDKHAAYITLRDPKKVDFSKDDRQKKSYETDESYLKRLKRENTGVSGLQPVDIREGAGKQMVDRLSKVASAIDENMRDSALQIFPDSAPMTSRDLDATQTNTSTVSKSSATTPAGTSLHIESTKDAQSGRVRRRVRFEDEVDQSGAIKSEAFEFGDEKDDQDDDDDADVDFDFNALGADDKEPDEEETEAWVLSDDDDEDDVEAANDVDMEEAKSSGVWDETWLQTPDEVALEKGKQKKQKMKKDETKRAESSSTADQSNARWKQNLLANASDMWNKKMTIYEWVYGDDETRETEKRQKKIEAHVDDSDDDEFFKVKKPRLTSNELDEVDSAVSAFKRMELDNWDDESFAESIRNRFVTGDWIAAKKFQSEVEKRAHNVNPDLYDERVQKDRQMLESLGARTEDIAANQVTESGLDWEYRLEQLMKSKGMSEDLTMEDKIKFAQSGEIPVAEKPAGDTGEDEWSEEATAHLEAKLRKKEEFNREYDAGLLDQDAAYDKTGVTNEEQKKIFKNQFARVKRDRQGKLRGQGGAGEEEEDRKNLGAGAGRGEYFMDIVRAEMEVQNELNRTEFATESENVQNELRGYIPGTYVRIIVENVPSEFDINFDLEYPVIVGGLLPQEMEFGFVQCRIKKHRWHKRLLKFNDPLIVSIGWRRFQTMPVYCVEDRNSKRLRMIKYTPDHMHCLAIFYGPVSQPNAGLIGYNTCSPNVDDFRISATGTVLSCNSSYKIVKKLKVLGSPYEIHRNTCFVKGMFNTNLEVSKFIGAKIQTVSGVRGSIKKSEGQRGNFRATFEDRLLKSDIIFLKSWVPIEIKKFYFPVRSLLLNDKDSWNGMKTVGQLRAEQNKRPTFKKDSVYTDVGRKSVRKFNSLKIPKKVETALPFHLRPKINIAQTNKGKQKNVDTLQFASKEERSMRKMVASLSEIAANHQEREREEKRKKRKRKRVVEKKNTMEERKRKRQRIRANLSGANKERVNTFESTRGNKFHKEWRLSKK